MSWLREDRHVRGSASLDGTRDAMYPEAGFAVASPRLCAPGEYDLPFSSSYAEGSTVPGAMDTRR
ncbi:hypothetical protein [Caballeronia sp. LZ035]|uniref:hypothetical protein n=1 Tax=Caballeronia sp. LZ035 TaxID=3038568 RepID=UPI00285B3C45|nr:hypothetical protein [Caballeronia sp. LZ035]MDR5763413.1 hypothetical protein [Caballeronia sp. LZ035]